MRTDTPKTIYLKDYTPAPYQVESFDENSEEASDDILKEKRLLNGMKAFGNLGDSCKVLLMKFYFEKKSMNTIAEELDLDAASARNKKYRCMQKLRAIALETNK